MSGPIKSVMVVGYGTMGRGVLASFAEHGAPLPTQPAPPACVAATTPASTLTTLLARAQGSRR